jgi:hypothetical protein
LKKFEENNDALHDSDFLSSDNRTTTTQQLSKNNNNNMNTKNDRSEINEKELYTSILEKISKCETLLLKLKETER